MISDEQLKWRMLVIVYSLARCKLGTRRAPKPDAIVPFGSPDASLLGPCARELFPDSNESSPSGWLAGSKEPLRVRNVDFARTAYHYERDAK